MAHIVLSLDLSDLMSMHINYPDISMRNNKLFIIMIIIVVGLRIRINYTDRWIDQYLLIDR